MTFATRFAPSPTGYLHRGHAFSALSAWAAAQTEGGRFVLRVEDIDRTRCRPEFEAAIHEDLAWLGLDWEQPVRRQSEHTTDYLAALERLREQGLVYRCFKTRREIAQAAASAPHGPGEGPEGLIYTACALPPDEEQAALDAGRPFAWRLSITGARARLGHAFDALTFVEEGEGAAGERGVVAARAEQLGDVILARKDVGVAYHLAVVVDDALQQITHVIRGQDLLHATGVQRLLQVLLGLPEPRYRHHRLLAGADGKRFAKRDRAETLREIRAAGVTPEQLRTELGFA
jgi:glutamyl-Q tRNA(Asp) synthetase